MPVCLINVTRNVPRKSGLDRGDADLAIALHGMAVAGRQLRTRIEHRQVQCRAGADILVVDVAAEGARNDRRSAVRRCGGGATPMTPKNGAVLSSSPHGMVTTPRARSIGT